VELPSASRKPQRETAAAFCVYGLLQHARCLAYSRKHRLESAYAAIALVPLETLRRKYSMRLR